MALYFGNQLVSLTSINSGRGIDTSERTAVQLRAKQCYNTIKS